MELLADGTDQDLCANSQLDEGETDIDCGGPNCAKCGDGMHCTSKDDCNVEVSIQSLLSHYSVTIQSLFSHYEKH